MNFKFNVNKLALLVVASLKCLSSGVLRTQVGTQKFSRWYFVNSINDYYNK